MSNFEIIDKDMSLDEVSKSVKTDFQKTNGTANFFLTSLLAGTSLMAPSQSFSSENIILDKSNNQIEECLIYDSNVNKNLEDYIKVINSINVDSKSKKQSIIKEIISFRSLDNSWDGYGALPLEALSAANSINLIDLIGENIFCKISNFYPNPNGTITLEWENELEDIVSIEVGNKTMSYFVDISSSKVKFFNKIEINAKECLKVSEYIQSL